jgi:hypothetical protein
MRQNGVSLTCCVKLTEWRKWFLTREGGPTPPCESAEHCGCDTTFLPCEELRKAYMEVSAFDRGSGQWVGMIAELCEESVCVIKDITRNLSDCWRGSATKVPLRHTLRDRAQECTSCIYCSITAGDVFRVCGRDGNTGVAFVKVLRYAGKKPFPAAPWYTGLTDAMYTERGEKPHQQWEWNLCPHGRMKERIASWRRARVTIP